jgi:hypothetical protein
MSDFAVARVHSVIVLAPPGRLRTHGLARDAPLVHDRPHAERTALIEPRGALLYWDELDSQRHPYAEIHEPALAADWLWEVYGTEAAAAILSGAEAVTAEAEPPVLDAARGLAHLRWAEAWWPASHEAAVPALSAGLLRAEIAWRTAGLEHLLDDEEAVERALDFDLGPLSALEDHPVLGAEARGLAADLGGLAEDYGVVPQVAEARVRPEDWTLAAGGGSGDGLALAGGSSPVDWSLIPQGTADAAGEARWSLVQRGGEAVIAVEVPAAPRARGAALAASVGGAEIALRLDPDTGLFTGEAEAPQGFLMLPTGQRTLHVFDPAFALPEFGSGPDDPARRPAIIAHAYERLAAADACLAERAAALGIDLA